MNDSFASLKRSRDTSLERLSKEMEKLTQKNVRETDDRLWYPEVDKSGNGYAVIRFLPAAPGEDVPWVRLWNHAFQGPGGWYIENSLTTLSQQDPVSELNSKLWNSGSDKDKEIARKQKRKLTYYSNVLIVKDAAKPENEGRVVLYKYGKKIFDKLSRLMNPEFADEEPMNPFDLWSGCNLKLKIRTVEGYRNYDESTFSTPSPVAGNDEDIEKIWKKQHPLMPFVASDQFKSYDELTKRLNLVLGKTSGPSTLSDTDSDPLDDAPPQKIASPVGKTAKPPAQSDDLDFFRKLAEED